MTAPEAGKVPAAFDFLDISDYARPVARWLVSVLLNTSISPIHITLAFALVGLAAAWLLAVDRWLWLAGILLLVKSALDGADGSLARARQAPSRVGRFLDSVCDFVVNLAVFGAIAVGAIRRGDSPAILMLAGISLLSAVLQVSLFNRFYVLYRAQTGGDQTSHVTEDAAGGYSGDNPALLRFLYAGYRAIYGWQDLLVGWLDRTLAPDQAPLRAGFLSAASVLGLGTQLAVITVCAVLGQPIWALWVFATAFNVYALLLLVLRR
ncbi:MAG: CDP-alcohol phosphatidyltransferase family protein [Anaerolineales bacterium]